MGVGSVLNKSIAVLVPGLIWISGFMARPHLVRLDCARDPSPCTTESVNFLDRIVFSLGSKDADFASNVVQNVVIVLTFLLPWILFSFGKFFLTRASAWSMNLSLLALTAWNGAIIEWTRNLIQRPRPLVFMSPLGDGTNPHQYTSFYSGHTSFVALATMFWLLVFWQLKGGSPFKGSLSSVLRRELSESEKKIANAGFRFFAVFTALSIPLVGLLRVWGGRHYPSDVLAGACIGIALALRDQVTK